MTAPEPRAGLTEREVDSLTECPDCEHWANEHVEAGCLGTVERGTGVGEHEDQCACMLSPERIARERFEEVLAARLAARDAEWVARLTALPDRMLDAWGGPTPWATTPSRVASLVSDWHDTLVEEVTRG